MENSMIRILIETVTKKSLHDIKSSPERGIRNLIDTALQFSRGQFQKNLFAAMQTMLKNESSAYYSLVSDIISTVDEDRLLEFGMTLGYNSCMIGTKTIRKNEKILNCTIPWAIKLQVDPFGLEQYKHQYSRVIKEGNQLGIYTWMFFTAPYTQDLLRLVTENPDNCFFVFCDPEDVTEDFVEAVSETNNLMIVVRYEEEAEDACLRLREQGLLYSVYYPYSSKDIDTIVNCDLFYTVQELHPLFSVFLAQPDCPDSVQKLTYQTIQTARANQQHRTILLDLLGDNRMINEIISNDPCTVNFDKKGILHHENKETEEEEYNLFTYSLQEILQQTFPKKDE